jgi:hypothetical protein
LTRLTFRYTLVPILYLVILSPLIMPGQATPAYSAGVTVGQWASYTPLNVTYSTIIPEPQFVKDLNRTAQFNMTIQHVYSASNVNIRSVSQFKNATTKAAILNGDLMTGAGNLSYALIAGGLSQLDPIWAKPLAPEINQTISMNYLGTPITVNISNFTMTISTPLGVANSRQELVWDQTSGILLEAKALVFLAILGPSAGFVGYTHVRIDATNIFYHPPTTPSFTVTATTPVPVNSGKTATSTIMVTPVNGFTGTVALTDTIPAGLTCSAITPSTVVGSGTGSLSCSSTNPSAYTISIAGASDAMTRTTTITITVTAVPSPSPNAPSTILGLPPVVFYSMVGIATAIVTAAFLALRTKSNRARETGQSDPYQGR